MVLYEEIYNKLCQWALSVAGNFFNQKTYVYISSGLCVSGEPLFLGSICKLTILYLLWTKQHQMLVWKKEELTKIARMLWLVWNHLL